jgi:O-antigen ligase
VATDTKPWLFHWAVAIYLAGLCTMAGSLLADPRRLRWVINCWAAATTLTVALGVLGVVLFYAGVRDREQNPFLWNYGSVPAGNYPRLYVLFRNGNVLCNYLTVSVGLLLAFGDELLPVLRRLRPYMLGGAVVVALFTLSPGLGGLGLTVALWAWWSDREQARWRKPYVLGGLATAVGLVVVSVVALNPAGTGGLSIGPVDVSLSGSVRIVLWSAALASALSSPWVGCGLGYVPAWVTDPRTFTPRDQWNDELMQQTFAPRAMDAHNLYLSVFAQLGLVGLALVLCLAWVLVRRLCQVGLPARWGLAAAFWGGVAHHGLFASLEEARHVWILFGLVLALSPQTAPMIPPLPVLARRLGLGTQGRASDIN